MILSHKRLEKRLAKIEDPKEMWEFLANVWTHFEIPRSRAVLQTLAIRERGRRYSFCISKRNWWQWGIERRVHKKRGDVHRWVHLGIFSIFVGGPYQ